MSVLLETSVGDIVIDLHTEAAPRSCTNFLKLCSKHFYKLNAFFRVERDFLAQTGDPTNTGKGGASIWSQLPSTSRDRLDSSLFRPDTDETLKHTSKGTVSFACIRSQHEHAKDEEGVLLAGSQFFITLKDDIEYLDGKHVPFGTVVEGQEAGGTLDKINAAFTDDQKRPLKDIRIRHVVVLEDPFPDPDGFSPPSRSPSPTPSQLHALRLADDEDLSEERDETEKEQQRRDADTNAAALTLEMVGDLPFAEIRPPENILFVCKLNPVTRSEDLELIFSRFGRILSCEVIKDKKTGDSLQYAFIEFDKKDDAERAYFKMQNVLVDDRRIWVDFSQSVSRLHGDWVKKRNGGREPPRGHYKWGDQSSRNGSQSASRTSSYRPRDHGGRAESSEHVRRDQRQDRDRQDRSQRVRSPCRDDSRERDHKRSRRQDDDDRRYRRSDEQGRSTRDDRDRRHGHPRPQRDHTSSRSERSDRERDRDYDRRRDDERDGDRERASGSRSRRDHGDDKDRRRQEDRSRHGSDSRRL